MNKKAFTLLELLVVILIIGILASIAIPQYKLSVLKSQYARIKIYAETIYGGVQRYYLTNNVWPTQMASLDIEIPGQMYGGNLRIYHGKEIMQCSIWYDGNGNGGVVTCSLSKFGYNMQYNHYFQDSNGRSCYAGTTDTNTISAKLCQIETGKTSTNGYYTYQSKIPRVKLPTQGGLF